MPNEAGDRLFSEKYLLAVESCKQTVEKYLLPFEKYLFAVEKYKLPVAKYIPTAGYCLLTTAF
jgi:hypothetical protein